MRKRHGAGDGDDEDGSNEEEPRRPKGKEKERVVDVDVEDVEMMEEKGPARNVLQPSSSDNKEGGKKRKPKASKKVRSPPHQVLNLYADHPRPAGTPICCRRNPTLRQTSIRLIPMPIPHLMMNNQKRDRLHLQPPDRSHHHHPLPPYLLYDCRCLRRLPRRDPQYQSPPDPP